MTTKSKLRAMSATVLAGAVVTTSVATEANPNRNKCFGVLDYAGKLVPHAFQLNPAATQRLEDGRSEISIGFKVQNKGISRYEFASVIPVKGFADLGIDTLDIAAGQVDTIGPNETASSRHPLVVALPTPQIPAFLKRLRSGDIELTVHASETPTLNAGHALHRWAPEDDGAFRRVDELAHAGTDEGASRPGAPSSAAGNAKGYSAELYYSTSAPQAFINYDPTQQRLHFTPDEGGMLKNIPKALRFFTADHISVAKDPRGGQRVRIIGHTTRSPELRQIYASVSLCADALPFQDLTGPQPIALAPAPMAVPSNRHELFASDGASVDAPHPFAQPVLDVNISVPPWKMEPLRFNKLKDTEFTCEAQVSGQFAAISVAVNSLGFQLDNTGVSMNLGLSARGTVSAGVVLPYGVTPSTECKLKRQLLKKCIPIDNIDLGWYEIPTALEFKMSVEALIAQRFNAQYGLTVDPSFSIGLQCNLPNGGTPSCEALDGVAVVSSTITPITPAQLSLPGEAEASVKAVFDTSLLLGEATGATACEAPTKFTLTGKAGPRLKIKQPNEWSLDLVAEAKSQLTLLEFLGFEEFNFPIPLWKNEWNLLNWTPDSADDAPQTTNTLSREDRFITGEDQRWAVRVKSNVFIGGWPKAYTDVTRDGDVILAAAPGRLVKLDRFGQMQWWKSYAYRSLRRVHALADGTIATLSTPAAFARHDADGSVRNAFLYDLSDGTNTPYGFSAYGMTPIANPDGTYDFIIVGEASTGYVPANDAAVFRIQSDGSVVWAKIYSQDSLQELHGVTVARNGDLVVAGHITTGPNPFALGSGWLMRLNADDGSIIWSRALPTTRRGGLLSRVVEAPDGTLYASGQSSRIVWASGSAWLVKVSGDGQTASHVLLTHDEGLDAALDFEDSPPVQFGDGAYDDLPGLAVVGDSVVVAGYSGYQHTAWLARFSADLDPEWFTVLDGAGFDAFTSVAAADDAIIAAGMSSSLNENGVTDYRQAAMVMKVPFEGGINLHPAFSNLVTQYLSPGVIASSELPDIVPEETIIMDAEVIVLDAVVDSVSDISATLLRASDAECAQLLTATGHPTTTDSCPDADYQPPVVRIVSPTATEYSSRDSLALNVHLFDENGLSASAVLLDGIEVDPQAVLDLSTLSEGPHRLSASAVDNAANAASDEIIFTVSHAAP